MTFSTNHPILFLLAGILVAVVLGQSVYFLAKALKRSKEIGMDQTKIKKTIKTAAIFTVAPAVSIVISVITLSKSLGIPLPWLRLSVVEMRSIGPAVTREQSPAFLRNSNGRLDLPGPTQEAA